MKNIIITGPQGSGKTTMVREMVWRMGFEPINILDMKDAAAQVMTSFNGRFDGGQKCFIFDAVITSPREAIHALTLMDHARQRFPNCEITAIFVDQGENFVLTDRQIKLG